MSKEINKQYKAGGGAGDKKQELLLSTLIFSGGDSVLV